MRKLFLTLLVLSICCTGLFAEIQYSVQEYALKGRNYSIKNYPVLYFHMSGFGSKEIIWIYFTKSNGQYQLTMLAASKALEQKLPLLVLKFIGEQITAPKLKESKSEIIAKEETKRAIEKALDQKYKDALVNQGAELIKDITYERGYYSSKRANYHPSYYYDYVPLFLNDSTKDMVINSPSANDIWKFNCLYYITDQLKSFGYHHDLKSLAKWPENVMNRNGDKLKNYKFNDQEIKINNEYHKRLGSCHFKLEKIQVKDGDRYPNFAAVSYFGWVATYCNYFAMDLQEKVFGERLWATNGCASDYDNVPKNKDFVMIDRTNADTFKRTIKILSDAGYFVFFITPTHTTTVYSVDKNLNIKVVQAGAEVGILYITDLWENFDEKKDLKTFVYLGHLKK